MGVEIACDVEGCDSRTPVMGVPQGWTLVIRAPDELALSRARKAFMSPTAEMLEMGPMGPQKKFICDKHELPKLKATR